MLAISKISILAYVAISLQLTQAILPPEFEKCAFDDAVCSTNVAKSLLKNNPKTGWRAINLIPFDPLHIKSLKLEPNPNSPVSIGLTFTNIDILGLANTQNIRVEGFTSDVNAPILLEGRLPQAIIRGPYQGSGTVSGLPFKGNGDCEIVLTNIKLTCKLRAKLVKKGTDEYLSIDDVSLTMSQPDNVHFKFGGLFDGNNGLSETANAFLNDNWREIYASLKKDMEQAFALIVKGIITNVFVSQQYRDFFKEQ